MFSVSIILNTLDRYALTVRCVGPALEQADYPFELLVCDQGSTDTRVLGYIKALQPAYLRLNATNEGIAPMHNQMMLRAKGDLIVFIDNDIKLAPGWLKALVDAYAQAESVGIATGVCGIHTMYVGPVFPVFAETHGFRYRPALPPHEDNVFGTRMIDRNALDKVGYFSEWGMYGLVDNAYNRRVYHAGLVNYYIDFPSAVHLDFDSGAGTPYRKMKDAGMVEAAPLDEQLWAHMQATGNYYVPPPELR